MTAVKLKLFSLSYLPPNYAHLHSSSPFPPTMGNCSPSLDPYGKPSLFGIRVMVKLSQNIQYGLILNSPMEFLISFALKSKNDALFFIGTSNRCVM